jgi:lysophospholipase L1-like esterase
MALALAVAAPAGAAPQCPPRTGAASLTAPLIHMAAKIRGAGDIVIVAVGSSSTAGYGASAPAMSYPHRLAADLEARLPGRHVDMHNAGIGGETDVQMMARFDRDVMAYKPDLVIWQLGTNALLKEDGVTRDAPRIKAGIERLKAAGADVVLMNPQYAPKVLKDPDHGEMVQLLDKVAAEEHVAMFSRFAIMRQWVISGTDYAEILNADGLHMNDTGYGCIAQVLAESILSATGTGGALVAATPTK